MSIMVLRVEGLGGAVAVCEFMSITDSDSRDNNSVMHPISQATFKRVF